MAASERIRQAREPQARMTTRQIAQVGDLFTTFSPYMVGLFANPKNKAIICELAANELLTRSLGL